MMQDASTRAPGALVFGIKALASGAVLWLLLSRVGAQEVVAQLSLREPIMAVLALAILVVQLVMGATRWRMICGALGVYVPPRGKALGWTGMGVALSQILPSAVGGDAYRIVALAQHAGVGPATRTVVAERLIGLVTLAAIGLILSLFATQVAQTPFAFQTYAALSFAVLAGGVLAGVAARLLARWRSGKLVDRIAEDVRLLSTRSSLLQVVTITAAMHACSLAAILCLGSALALDVPHWQALLAAPGALLASAIPFSLGGWGAREAGMVFGLSAFAVPGAAALALSIAYGLALAVTGVLGLLFWILGTR